MHNKVLLTGATGFLGTYIKEQLKKQYKVHTLGRSAANTIKSDITKPIPPIKTKYEYLIHNAGKAHTNPKTETEKQAYKAVNYTGTINLCKALESNPPENIVYISTIAVYGKETSIKITENEALNGKTPYAKSKIKAEAYLQEWAKENKVNLVILRLPLVAGKNPKGNLQAMIKGIEKGYYINIANSTAKKSIVLAEDVAAIIPQLKNKNGIYNLAGEKDYTFKEIAAIIAKQQNNKKVHQLPYAIVKIIAIIGDLIPFIPINSKKLKKITNNTTVTAKKAIQEINWKPRNLEENFKIK